MKRSSWNQIGKSYKKNMQLLSKCLMCSKVVGTPKLSEIEQENFDEISIAKSGHTGVVEPRTLKWDPEPRTLRWDPKMGP